MTGIILLEKNRLKYLTKYRLFAIIYKSLLEKLAAQPQ